jgi:hypothetical protein
MVPLSFMPSASNVEEGPSRRMRSSHRRRGRRRSDSDIYNFDQASQFLQHFHGFASQSLNVILEHSESGEDDDYFPNMCTLFRSKEKQLTKVSTCSCLTTLAVAASSKANTSALSLDFNEGHGRIPMGQTLK